MLRKGHFGSFECVAK